MNTPSVKRRVKRQRQRQGPIGIHCDAPKSVPDPFPSVNPSVTTSKLPLGLFIPLSYIFNSRLGLQYIAISTENILGIFFFSGISINEKRTNRKFYFSDSCWFIDSYILDNCRVISSYPCGGFLFPCDLQH